MIESKAFARVTVSIICLVSPLKLSVTASTSCQDSMKLYCPKWEHPPWRQRSLNQSTLQWWSRLGVCVFLSGLFMGHSAADRPILWPVGYVMAPQTKSLPCPEFWYLYASYYHGEKKPLSLLEKKLEVTQYHFYLSRCSTRVYDWLLKCKLILIYQGHILSVSISCPLKKQSVFAGSGQCLTLKMMILHQDYK